MRAGGTGRRGDGSVESDDPFQAVRTSVVRKRRIVSRCKERRKRVGEGGAEREIKARGVSGTKRRRVESAAEY